jgi:CheY-like chemotaxis protein
MACYGLVPKGYDRGNLSLARGVFHNAGIMDLRALVVCPDEDSARLLTLILSELGMVVEHAPSIADGIELLESRHYDGIVLDYRADQGSEDFLSSLRRSVKNNNSVLIAVVDSEFNARPVFGLGANFVLYRPLSSERTRISLRAAGSLMRRERRRAPRTPVNSTANVAYPGAPETSAVLSDLSDGGTLLQTNDRLPSTCKVYFEFELPGQQQLVRLSGEVAWQDSSGQTGIRFLDVPQASRRVIQTWLQQNNPRPAEDSAAQSSPNRASRTQSSLTESKTGEFRAEHTGESSPQLDLPPAPKPGTKKSGLVTNAGNRRGEPRLACKLGAEIYGVSGGVPNFCTLSDISEGGCYVEMPSPLSGESTVEILVRTAHAKLRIRGQVMTTHPGFGMGVRFIFRNSAAREELLRLLGILAAGPSLDEQPR